MEISDKSFSLRVWWVKRRTTLLSAAIFIMVVAGSSRLAVEFWRLIFDTGPKGAIDLKFFHNVVHAWFTRNPIHRNYTYPPASYLLLWPLFGWMDLEQARWFYAVTVVLILALLVLLMVRISGADTRLERLFVALIPLSIYATSVTIGNGQITIHILTALVCGLLLIHNEQRNRRDEILALGLLTFSMVKPSVTAPFFFLLFLVRGSVRNLFILVLGYAALTILSASLHGAGPVELLRDWLAVVSDLAERGSAGGSYANIHTWLITLGMAQWLSLASLLLLVISGIWIYYNRRADFWLLVGIMGIVSRIWSYHRVYDDLLILLPMISLFRIARQGKLNDGSDVAAGVLLAVTLAAALAPARLHTYPPPWNLLFTIGQTIIWIAVLIFLIYRVHCSNREEERTTKTQRTQRIF